MEIITATAISTIVNYLGKTMFNKSFETAVSEFTKDGVKWLKGLFHHDDTTPSDTLADLQQDPNDQLNIDAAEVAIKKDLKKFPENQKFLNEIYLAIKRIEEGSNHHNSFNVGGDYVSGDNNQINKKDNSISMHGFTAGNDIKVKINTEQKDQ